MRQDIAPLHSRKSLLSPSHEAVLGAQVLSTVQAKEGLIMSFHRMLLGAQVLSFAPVSPTLSRKIKTACGLFYGRYGLPLPNPAQIVSVVGTPIPGACCQCSQ